MRFAAILMAALLLASPARAQSGAGDARSGDRLTAQFMGVSTILLSDGETNILLDGFFSRPSFSHVVSRRLTPDRARIDWALARAEIRSLAGVLVAHAHYDHAMDSAVIAADFAGAPLIGSSSVANIGLGQGLTEEQILRIADGDALRCGQFRIQVLATPHSPHIVLWALTGTIDAPLETPAHAIAYKDNLNFSFLVAHRGRRILIHPSAHHADGVMGRRQIRADLVFLGIGDLGRRSQGFTDRYWREVVQATGARMVVPIHWDDFFRSLEEPLEPGSGFGLAMTRLATAASRDGVEVRLPAPFVPFDLGAPADPPGRESPSSCKLDAVAQGA